MASIKKITILIIAIFCIFVQVVPVVRSGITYSFGKGYWGPTGHDGIWHLALINNINNPLDIDMPIYAGEKLRNYHPFFDIMIAIISKTTRINSELLLFQIYPLVSASIFVYLSYWLGKHLTKSDWGGVLMMITQSTSNSFGWLISILNNRGLGGESIFWAMQSPSNQINPPYVLSLILLLLLLNIILISRNKELTNKHSIVILLIIIFSPVIKAYAALPILLLFGFYTLRSKNKRNYKILFIGLVGSIVIYSLYNKINSGILVFEPFWFLRSLIDSPDKFYLPRLSSLRFNLEAKSSYDLRLIIIYSISFIIFIVGNFSWRLIGIIKSISNPSWLIKSLLLIIVILIIIPTLFIQKGTSWNTIQFIYYAQFLADILLVNYLTQLDIKKISTRLLIITIVSANLLAFIGMLPNYTGQTPPTSISHNELEALDYLRQLPKGIILSVPYDRYLKNNFSTTPIPLYAYETTSYLSAFSHKPSFLEDEMNLENSGYDVENRRSQSVKFFNQSNVFEDRGFLLNNQISYIYLAGIQKNLFNLSDPSLFIEKIFDNPDATIFRVIR